MPRRLFPLLFVGLLPLLAATKPTPFTPAELDTLLAPVALYPDPLLAQTLPATTTPLDLVEATQWLRDTPAPTEQAIDAQPWSPAVRALTHYPKVLRYLTDNIAWTRQLGDAYANQRAAVNQSIQRLRAQARRAGSLPSSPQQTIIQEPNTLSIQPADPEVIYVPIYDPQVIYTHRHPPRFEDPCPSAPLHPHDATPPAPKPAASSFSATVESPSPTIYSTDTPEQGTSTYLAPTPTPAPAPTPAAPTPQPEPAAPTPPAAAPVQEFHAAPPTPEPTTSTHNGVTTITR